MFTFAGILNEKHPIEIHMIYKLLVLDLDGTLTNRKKEVTKRTRRSLIQAQERGVKIALASGRPTYGMAPLADMLGLKEYGGYVLSYNGGEIIDWKTGETIYAKLLDPEVIPYLYRCATEGGFAIVTYNGKYVVTEHPDDKYVQKEALLNVMTLQKVDNFLEAVRFPVAKCLIVGEPRGLAKLETEMRAQLEGRMGVFRSEPYFLELVPDGIDKAQSLSVLLEHTGLKREETIAVGDGYNDLPMIQFAGVGIAMSNAQEVVRRHADYVTLSNEEEGVAAVVEKFIL